MICGQCQIDKPLSDFVANRGKNIRRCKSCSKIHCKLQKREYYDRNTQLVKDRTTANQSDRIAEWSIYLQKRYGDPSCECCHKELSWPGKGKIGSVHFDHRHEGVEAIKGGPTVWMRCRRATLENILIFESCDFGILCNDCNRCLPTHNRIQWLEQAIQYAKNTKANLVS